MERVTTNPIAIAGATTAQSLLPASGGLSRGVHRAFAPLARRLAAAGLRQIERGRLTVIDDGGSLRRMETASPDVPMAATIHVHDPSAYSALVLRGSVGVAESYMRGEWDCDDLTALGRIAAAHPAFMDGLLGRTGAGVLNGLFRTAARLRRNTLAQSRRNVAAHYDLGNDFFEFFLDPTLTYSCAVFERDGDTLEQAQIAKYDRICRKLDLRPGQQLLEIGTGWGGFAIHAARHYGCRVVTTTISRQQFALARERVAAAGLSGSVAVLNDDYRDIRGRFDRLVAIEMIEAVGAEFLETFFAACSGLLRPNGLMVLQAILTPEPGYAASLRSVDFLKRYVFPGGQLPSVGVLCASTARRTDLRLTHLEDLTPHYPTTLRHWHDAFTRNRTAIAAHGYPETLLRLWDLYLGWCEGYFLERAIGVAHLAFAKPLCRSGPVAGR